MKTELVKISASDYGLEETKASEIKAMFTPMLEKMEELETEYNDLIQKEITPQLANEAATLRKKYVKVRTGTADIHKELKAFYLKGGRFVDAFKNTQEFASGEKEKVLKSIEEHFENIERERKEKVKLDRIALIQPYVEDVNTFMLGEMTESAFELLLRGAKDQYELRLAAEKQAEIERIEKERKDALHSERKNKLLDYWQYVPDDNKAYFGDIEMGAWEKLYEGVKNKKAERDAEIEAQKKEAERLQKEIEKKNKEAEEARKKQDAIIAKEKEKAEAAKKEKERLESEIKHREAEELRKQKEAEEAAKKASRAPDKTKILVFADVINSIELPEMKTAEGKQVISNTDLLLKKVVTYLRENADRL